MGDIHQTVLRFLALLPALTLHEFAHAYSAHKMGDPTPRLAGRVTLNPLAHLDPVGTLMILFAPIGWAKPVPINPMNFRDPVRGTLITSACGPASNIVQGIFWALVLRTVMALSPQSLLYPTFSVQLLAMMALINFVLAFFNLIPLGPLDGHHVLAALLPPQARWKYEQFNRYGFAILMGLILFSFLTRIPVISFAIVYPAFFLVSIASGVPVLLLVRILFGGA